MSKEDQYWLLTLLLVVLYFAVLALSGCEFLDAPFGFVRGCFNYGIDWNAFMAPLGMVMLVALPCSLIYWLSRLFGLFGRLARHIMARIIHWFRQPDQ